MTSNDDLMGFLLKMEEKRAADKEEQAEIRKKEREEDRDEMMKLMDNCVGEKILAAVGPLGERTEKVETAQLEMKDQVNMLMEEMKAVKENLSSRRLGVGESSSVRTLAEVASGSYVRPPGPLPQAAGFGGSGAGTSEGDSIRPIISLSRRTVGLQKIDKDDLIRMRQEQFGGAQNEEEEKLLAVREYLHLEIKLAKTTIEKMEIERIFPPASARDNPLWLYVTFKQEASVHKIYEKTRIMRKESRILTYIPKEFHSRFVAIRDIENSIRLEEKCKTRVKMGFMDLQLHKKDRLIGKWQLVSLPAGLPPVELGISPKKADSGSPAPGRPGQVGCDKRSRESSDSSTGENTPKAARTDTKEDSSTNTSDVDSAIPVKEKTAQDNSGKVIEEESYCPASPAPSKSGSGFPYSSPVFS